MKKIFVFIASILVLSCNKDESKNMEELFQEEVLSSIEGKWQYVEFQSIPDNTGNNYKYTVDYNSAIFDNLKKATIEFKPNLICEMINPENTVNKFVSSPFHIYKSLYNEPILRFDNEFLLWPTTIINGNLVMETYTTPVVKIEAVTSDSLIIKVYGQAYDYAWMTKFRRAQ